jgi:hypothetical protein
MVERLSADRFAALAPYGIQRESLGGASEARRLPELFNASRADTISRFAELFPATLVDIYAVVFGGFFDIGKRELAVGI